MRPCPRGKYPSDSRFPARLKIRVGNRRPNAPSPSPRRRVGTNLPARFDRGPELASAAKVLADSAAVTRITLNKSLTGGNAHGDLFVAIEPRDGHGRVLDAPGALQVVALDPALSGQQVAVGRGNLPPPRPLRNCRAAAIGASTSWRRCPRARRLAPNCIYMSATGPATDGNWKPTA